MKAYSAFLTSALDRGEWPASRPGRFTRKERDPGIHWIGGWAGTRAVLNAVVKRTIPSPRRESNPRTPIVRHVAQHYTTKLSQLLMILSYGYECRAHRRYRATINLRMSGVHGWTWYKGFCSNSIVTLFNSWIIQQTICFLHNTQDTPIEVTWTRLSLNVRFGRFSFLSSTAHSLEG
jgi:hypothetical protein